MSDKIDLIIQKIQSLESTVNDRCVEIHERIDGLYASLLRIEKNKRENVVNSTNHIIAKIDDRDYRFDAINKRLFIVESEIERLSKK